MGGKESAVGPGRFANMDGPTKEIVHHYYNEIPSGEMSVKLGLQDESDSDSESDFC